VLPVTRVNQDNLNFAVLGTAQENSLDKDRAANLLLLKRLSVACGISWDELDIRC
jgi:hypothetical protein